ncbi:MAG: dihydropteroate synthase, partial [Acidimicrobiales bacterium]
HRIPSPTLRTVEGEGERRPLVMGVLNVTPDSFFDGGRYASSEAAIARGRAMFEEGADMVDVGGESSRPGASVVSVDEELRRVIPVIEALAPRGPVSVDTVKAPVARAAVAVGASLVNDVSGALFSVAAECGAGWVALHRKGSAADMQRDPRYDDVVAEVHEHLLDLARTARSAGVDEVWVDPGIGFGKTVEHNLALLAHVGELVDEAEAIDARVLVGTSNKWFLGVIASGSDGPLPPEQRSEGSIASSTWAMSQGVHMVRVHDVVSGVRAARLVGPVDRSHGALEGAAG